MDDLNEQEREEPILQFFRYLHLPPHLQTISAIYYNAAYATVGAVPRNAERTVALRKLLEGKDAAVRAAIFKTVAKPSGLAGTGS